MNTPRAATRVSASQNSGRYLRNYRSYARLLELARTRGRGTGSVRIHVSSLRRKLRGTNVRIENIHGAGYRLLVAPTALR